MDILGKLDKLRKERNWTNYELAKRAGISHTTISSMYKRNNVPTIPTLECFCNAFGITLSQFFKDGNVPVNLTDEQKEMLQKWNMLTDKQKKALYELIKSM